MNVSRPSFTDLMLSSSSGHPAQAASPGEVHVPKRTHSGLSGSAAQAGQKEQNITARRAKRAPYPMHLPIQSRVIRRPPLRKFSLYYFLVMKTVTVEGRCPRPFGTEQPF